jgi:hypothetical protein
VTSTKLVRGGQVRNRRISVETFNEIEGLQTEERPLILSEQQTQKTVDNNNIKTHPYIG